MVVTATMPGIMARMDAALAARREQGEPMRRAILVELARRERENLPAPTWAELAAAVGVRHGTSVRYHCAILRRRGLVSFDDSRTRTIRLTQAGRATS